MNFTEYSNHISKVIDIELVQVIFIQNSNYKL